MPGCEQLPAVVTRWRHSWYCDFELGGRRHRLPVTDADAWNYDVERGLPVTVELREGLLRITGKRRGNKRYVRIDDGATTHCV